MLRNEAGTPAKPVRLIVGIMLLHQMYKMSDEEAVYKWVENPYWQLFCGYDYLQWKFPIHPTTLTKWRQRLGSEGIGSVFEKIAKAAADCGMVQPKASPR
ncbi:MAG: transposase [Parachlamydia sp.]|nr:transposase [Parachlamydia sp.]